MGGKKKQFPTSAEVSDSDPVAWRSSEDMIEIANAAMGATYATFSPAIQSWVRKEARKHGWRRVYFPLAYPSRTRRAGAVFVKKRAPKTST